MPNLGIGTLLVLTCCGIDRIAAFIGTFLVLPFLNLWA
jgi:hypothetical protein